MQKIQSLFKRDYEGTRLVYNEVVEGSEWVIAGEGVATIKLDGTACMVCDGRLYKRYDRKVSKSAMRKKSGFTEADYKPPPNGWIATEETPDEHTGHFPGWLPVGDGSEDQYHREAMERQPGLSNGTYELIGPKVQGNPYSLDYHKLVRHGQYHLPNAPRTFDELKQYLSTAMIEGIVWHRHDGRMVKIKAKDFGIDWTIALTNHKEP